MSQTAHFPATMSIKSSTMICYDHSSELYQPKYFSKSDKDCISKALYKQALTRLVAYEKMIKISVPY